MTTTERPALAKAPATAAAMAGAAKALLAEIGSDSRLAFEFGNEQQFEWDYRPHVRAGVPLLDMSANGRRAAMHLVEVSVGIRANEKATSIMSLESTLADHEALDGTGVSGRPRDPSRYYFVIYGDPGGSAPWGWQVDGHHVSLNYTVVDNEYVAVTPTFFGANPAVSLHGENAGFRALPEEEDVARDLLYSLSDDQRKIALQNPVAPPDIISDSNARVMPGDPIGINLSALDDPQRDGFVELIHVYVDRMTDEIAANQWKRIEGDGLDTIKFAWKGGPDVGDGHYYAVQGPRFLIEYDNTQNDANHIHSVWRDYISDWGDDMLGRHYSDASSDHGHGD
ncbi:MAG TPA: DUF3500 domain-containing protein [Dehalococcoidia bacterium]|nr:hypothetical protein [Chloroflexota bacterium]MDP7212723.1 DUF3500 domain-containing protein [Dehalococcoidia bacterium]MDP7514929.1 DUF3500 domain-containing protein [Dehalococcoidia bacterium]HCV27968.1 hypothetical protein [Dehalococcoidia bacterium]HJM53052.1 DUF3500 domain-containing protein [Dehalococcoidia bacterium]